MSVELIHGDCLDVLRSLPDASVDAVVTDPPYGIGGQVARSVGGTKRRVESLPAWDVRDEVWIAEAARTLRPNGSLVAFCDRLRPGEMWDACANAGLTGRSLIYWVKHDPPPCPRRTFRSTVEVAVWAVNGLPAWNGGALTSNVWYGGIVKSGRLHPTQKPVDLFAWLIGLVTLPGSTVLDPFAGSGTTGLASIAEGRSAILIEREAEYVEIARRRIEAARAQLALPLGAD